MMEYSENVGIAFAVCIGAGLSTAIGASVVFFPSLIQFANRKSLASGLGLSGGVMTYVSFVEIFPKSVASFVRADFLQKEAYMAATLCFFAGIILMICLNFLIHGVAAQNLLTTKKGQEEEEEEEEEDDDESSVVDEYHDEESVPSKIGNKDKKQRHKKHASAPDDVASSLVDTQGPCCTAANPVERLEHIQEMVKRTAEIQHEEEMDQSQRLIDQMQAAEILHAKDGSHKNNNHAPDPHASATVLGCSDATTDAMEKGLQKKNSCTSSTASKSSKSKKAKKPSKKDQRRLTMMSLNTAIAIGLHNFPEGLATFVATLQDPSVGIVLAIAIAIHNIPEGLCVAMPVYYATGNRWRAFSWAVLSGLSEPFAAFLGWIVLASVMNDVVYAVLFGIIAGMMVIISFKELLPTAHRYDPDDSVVSNMFITGMAIMAISLVMFAQLK